MTTPKFDHKRFHRICEDEEKLINHLCSQPLNIPDNLCKQLHKRATQMLVNHYLNSYTHSDDLQKTDPVQYHRKHYELDEISQLPTDTEWYSIIQQRLDNRSNSNRLDQCYWDDYTS